MGDEVRAPLTRARLLLLLVILGGIVSQVPYALEPVAEALRSASLWPSPAAQYREAVGDVPLDLLLAVDARLPRDARIELVTSGADIRIREYTLFHRALYFLTPRPIHWIAPAPDDGTWEARSWTPAPVTRDSICSQAKSFDAAALVLVDVPVPATPCDGTDWKVNTFTEGTLIELDTHRDAGTASPVANWVTWPAGASLLAAILLALGIPFIIGYGIVQLIARDRFRMAQRVAVGWMIGWGATTLADAALGIASVPADTRRLLIGAAGLIVLTALLARIARGSPRWRRRMPRARDPRTALLVVVLVVEASVVTLLSVGQPLKIWDGWANWAIKARAIFIDGQVTGAVFADPTRASTHLAYPLNLPLIEAWLFGWINAADDRLAGLISIGTYLSLLAFTYGALRSWSLSLRAALAAAALLGAVTWVWRIGAAGLSDLPLAVLLTIATVLLIGYLRDGDRGRLVIGAFAGGLMGWTKMEGVIELACLVAVSAVLAVAARRTPLGSRAGRAGLAYLASGILVCGPWWAFVILNGIREPSYAITWDAIADGLARVPTIIAMMGTQLAAPQWMGLWIAAGAVGIVALWRAARGWRRGQNYGDGAPPRFLWILPVTATASLAALSGAYIVTTYAPYTAQIAASGFRLALQVLPITLIWLSVVAYGWLDARVPIHSRTS